MPRGWLLVLCGIVITACAGPASPTPPATDPLPVVNVVGERAPRLSLTRFAAFGDSITWGEDGRNEVGAGTLDNRVRPRVRVSLPLTYPSVLSASLMNRYPNQAIAVANLGEPGEPAQYPETLSRFMDETSTGAYEAVLLMEGTNDIFYGNPAQIAPAIVGLRGMVTVAKSRNLRVFLATVPPISGNAPRGLGAPLVPALNAEIRSLAETERVTLVDVWSAFGPSFQQYLGFDGLHPNEAGYAKIAETFFTVIRSTLEVPTTTTMPANRQTGLRGSPTLRQP